MKRNFGLDLLRAISIWLVLLQHAGINIPGLKPLKIGGIGVEIFFVISGYLIGGILFKEINKKNNLRKTLKNFWIRRWFRILPLYYLILAFKFTFIDDSISWNIIYYIFFLQNNFYGIDFFQVSWSLVIEEWFYLFCPIFLFYVSKFLKKESRIVYSIIILIFCIVLLRTIYVIQGNVPYDGINGNFPFRFDSLFIGVLLSFLNYKKFKLFDKLKSKKIFGLGIILFFGYIYYYWTLSFPNNLIDQSYFPRTLGFLILPLSIGLTIPYVSNINISNWKTIHVVFIVKTSILTYSIYLIHPFVYEEILYLNSIDSYLIRFILTIVITYGFALLVYHGFEKPILKYRDKITDHNII